MRTRNEVFDLEPHLVSDLRLGEGRTNRELLDLLERAGLIMALLVVPQPR